MPKAKKAMEMLKKKGKGHPREKLGKRKDSVKRRREGAIPLVLSESKKKNMKAEGKGKIA